ncbi:MAG: DUF3291 domain-containing protein [Woeseiaceae bacterium]
MSHQLATSNIARMRGQYEDEVMVGFIERLEPLNVLADASPGFIWRYTDESGNEARIFEDELILFNMSVWESAEALEKYAYHTDHREALQNRAQWFERSTRPSLVLWWIESGHIPTVEEAKERFDALWRDGPTEFAFTFRQRFAPPEA